MNTVWPEVALGDVCSIQIGKTPARATAAYWGEGHPWLSIGDMRQGRFISKTKETITDLAVAECNCKLAHAGTPLLSFKLTVGKVGISTIPLYTNEAIAHLPIRDESRLDPTYLCWVLDSLDLSASTDRAAMGQTLNKKSLREIRIPLPPLDEQRRIAAILDKADEVRTKRKAALETLETLSQAIFIEMFGEPSPPPISVASGLPLHERGWRWVELTDVARLATGHTPDRDRPDYWNGGIPWISLTEIRGLDGRVAESTELNVSEEGIAHSSSVVLPPGTVCFSRTASIGFVTVAGTEMATSQDFVNWVCGDSLDPTYLMTALLVSRPNLRSLSTGSTHKTIYMRIAEKFRVLLPPMDLQHRFAAQVRDGWKLLDLLEGAVEESDDLFSSLQQKAFQGAL